ncbi:MAG TPA: hypothetical protein VHV28_04865 [Solirubrobacteraceae bacterium]|jgi:hypothetical protein|nr:hypothetical protein [Solirubrobacteraceae bacterium]
MPTFCRHNRLVQNCPICSKEQDVEMRPVVSPGGHTVRPPRHGGTSGAGPTRTTSARGGVTVRQLSRAAEDGFRSALVPGLRSGADALRLAEELAFAATRLERLAAEPPGLYAEVADASRPVEERSWLAFLIAYVSPTDDEQPFAGIARARTSWSSGEPPHLDDVVTGPRSSYEPGRGQRTIDAYRAWAQRAGSQEAAFTGDGAWTPERRFARVFERLALPGLHRGARFDVLVTLGRLGVYDLSGGTLGLGGNDPVTLAAKRVLGIGDVMLLERRSADLAAACELPLEALDLGFYNWERGSRTGLGIPPSTEPDPALLDAAQAALGL